MEIIALTGASGAMGSETLRQLMNRFTSCKIKILLLHKDRKFGKKVQQTYKNRLEIIYGDIANYDDVIKLIANVKYVLHCAALIPPQSDHDQQRAKLANLQGTINIVDAIKQSGRADEIYYVHIGTVALYGHRNHKHLWARVGDPLVPSSYDFYALYKLKAERYVIEANLPNWVSLRQTAILHKNMFKNNMKDGLMFHTAWNAPLEWVTDVDSGRLLTNLVEKENDKTMKPGFWNNIYNIGGGDACRNTGYETLNAGFKIMGSDVKNFFKPNWNTFRNFHGTWFYDSNVLNDYLDFRVETNEVYWKRMAKKYWYYKLGRFAPKKMISKFVIQKLFKNSNSPMYWKNHQFTGRIDAFYGSLEKYEEIGSNWSKFPLLHHGKTEDGDVDYKSLRNKNYIKENNMLLNHGYDENKATCELDIEDMNKVAIFRGGKCLSPTMEKGDLHTPLEWVCHHGHQFKASPFLILKAGYWCAECGEKEIWSFDELSSKIPFFAQVWYDSHDKEEVNRTYPYSQKELDI